MKVYLLKMIDNDTLNYSTLIGGFSNREKVDEAISKVSKELGFIPCTYDFEVEEITVNLNLFLPLSNKVETPFLTKLNKMIEDVNYEDSVMYQKREYHFGEYEADLRGIYWKERGGCKSIPIADEDYLTIRAKSLINKFYKNWNKQNK